MRGELQSENGSLDGGVGKVKDSSSSGPKGLNCLDWKPDEGVWGVEGNGDESDWSPVGSWVARVSCSAKVRCGPRRSASLLALPGFRLKELNPRGGLHYVDRDSGLSTGVQQPISKFEGSKLTCKPVDEGE